jgi:hypothetical protein
MNLGKSLDKIALTHITAISDALNSLRKDKTLTTEQSSDLDQLYFMNNILFDVHEERAAKVHLSLMPGMWLVLILGTILTLSMTTILGMEQRLHMACVIAASLMVSSVVYLVITVDRPYRGDFAVQPDTLIATLKFISWQKNNYINIFDLHELDSLKSDKAHKKHAFLIP